MASEDKKTETSPGDNQCNNPRQLLAHQTAKPCDVAQSAERILGYITRERLDHLHRASPVLPKAIALPDNPKSIKNYINISLT
jgi:hypothetical protein